MERMMVSMIEQLRKQKRSFIMGKDDLILVRPSFQIHPVQSQTLKFVFLYFISVSAIS